MGNQPKNDRERNVYHEALGASKKKTASERLDEAMTALTAYRKKRKGLEGAVKGAVKDEMNKGSISRNLARRKKLLDDAGG